MCDASVLAQLGWGEYWERQLRQYQVMLGGELRPWRVARVDTRHVTLVGPKEECVVERVLVDSADESPGVLVGDWVAQHEDRYVVLPRRSELHRPDVHGGGAQQGMVANIDVVLIVEPCHPEPSLGRIERLLTIAHSAYVPAHILLTKRDLCDHVDAALADVRAVADDADVHAVDLLTGLGTDALDAVLREGVSYVLLGPSGAGKSTLLNHLVGTTTETTGAVRTDGAGRHTTTHRALHPLGPAGIVIDTPGMRAIGVSSTPDAIDHTFADVREAAQRCRFSDCEHRTEPDCGIKEAIDQGWLTARRVESYQKMLREAAHHAAKHDARARAEQIATWKNITAQQRQGRRWAMRNNRRSR